MKKLILILSFLAVNVQARQDNNIISFVVGQGPSGTTQTAAPGSSSSTSTCSSPGNSNCNGNSGNTTNTTTNISPSSVNSGQHYDAVTGIMYQRRIEDSPLLLGILIQSNQTYSTVIGVSF